MNTTPTPVNPGAVQFAADSAALAALDVDLTEGSKCFNGAVGANFVLTVSTADLVPNQIVAVSGNDGLRWMKERVGAVSVYTVFALSGAGPIACPGVKVGDRVCGGFWYDSGQSAFPISVNRGLLTNHGNFASAGDVIERIVTVDDQIQQVDDQDYTNYIFTIITQAG